MTDYFTEVTKSMVCMELTRSGRPILVDILPEEYVEPKKTVTYYQAVFQNLGTVGVHTRLFKSEDDAKPYTGFVRLLTEYPIEIEIEEWMNAFSPR